MTTDTIIENDVVQVGLQGRHANPLAHVQEPAAHLAARSATPADLLRIAVEGGADLDKLERLMKLQERWEADQARKAFVAAMVEFKKNPPTILKKKSVGYDSKDGSSTTSYMHATLADVVEPTVAALATHGFSHRWDTKQDGGLITVTCILTHTLGHSEPTELKAGADTSGKKNSIQAIASTVTYLERYTLLSACGLATKDMDDDGRSSEAAEEPDDMKAMLAEALATKTDAEALQFWKTHNPALAKRPLDHAKLKSAIARHRINLQGASQ